MVNKEKLMDLVYPGIIIITDSYPCQNGAGISQTLFNLFSGYPGKLFVYKNADEPMPEGNRLETQTISYQLPAPSLLSNRLGRLLNTTIEKVRYYRLQHHFRPIGLPDPQQHLVLVSTTTSEKLVLAQVLSKKYHYTVIPYFMDDWLCNNTMQWRGGSLQQVAADLLRRAPARLMISTHLQKILEQRYQLPFAPTLIMHNPSPLPTQTHIKFPPSGDLGGQTHPHKYFPPSGGTKGGIHTIIYAGSIWPMHADALISVARAIHLLHENGNASFQLKIYTNNLQWNQYQSILAGKGIQYAGWVPYAELPDVLVDGWLLLCVASFLPAHKAISYSSVQTKLTDYMATGIPVLFVGPPESASGAFVEKNDCGFCIYNNEPASISKSLLFIDSEEAAYAAKGKNGTFLAATAFSMPVVQNKLYEFMALYCI